MPIPITLNAQQVAQNGIDLLQNSGFQQLSDVTPGQELVGETAVVRPLYVGQSTVSYLIAQLQSAPQVDHARLVELRNRLNEFFNESELRDLCFTLNVTYESLAGSGKGDTVRELVDYARRNGRLADVIAYCRKMRPHVSWPTLPQGQAHQAAIVHKPDMAIVVSLAQPALGSAAAFLDKENVAANFILITNVPAYNETRLLNVDENWEEIARAFHKTMQAMRVKFPDVRCHFFFAAPVPLAFLMGCTWGTVYQGDKVYHWHRDTNNRSYFVYVGTVSRALRGE